MAAKPLLCAPRSREFQAHPGHGGDPVDVASAKTMLPDTMMLEGFEHGGNIVGLVTCMGFSIAFILSSAG